MYKQYPNLSNEELLKKVYEDIQQNPDVPKEYKDTLFLEMLWNGLGAFNTLGYPIVHRKK